MSEISSNPDVQRALARRVAEEISYAPACEISMAIGPLATNYFSFTFPVDVEAGGNRRRVFVKVPKGDLRGSSMTILPISSEDRRMAEEEANSLRILADQWQAGDLGVSWVRLRTVVPEYNAIVTDRVEAAEALDVFRRLDLRRRLGFREDARRLKSAMSRVGAALGRFHHRNARKTVFRVAVELPKLEHYCRELSAGIRDPWSIGVARALSAIANVELDAIEVQTLKGIDIRNVLIDDQDRLFLLDPGRIKPACREADLARFIMTYRILYWGSRLFLLGLRPDVKAEQAFLEAYYSNTAPPSPKLLSVFLIKEQIKHWHTALDSLRLLPWPLPVKRLVAATYVNPYYTRQLTKELKQVILMQQSSKYETETLNAYRTRQRAEEYKRYHTTDWSWARISTWREQRLLARELSRYSWSADDRLLDIPCGTGILGKLLHSFPFQIVASDISPEMMELARGEYPADRLDDCVQADITNTGLPRESFACIVVLGFLHRVPADIKRAALREIFSLTRRVVVVTCSVDSRVQRCKKKVLSIFRRKHLPAPCPLPLQDIIRECEEAGFEVIRAFMVIPFLSAEAMLVLERKS